jgi:hypothetical protein
VTREVGMASDEIDIPCPKVTMNYSRRIGCVNLADQRRGYYRIGMFSILFWMYI